MLHTHNFIRFAPTVFALALAAAANAQISNVTSDLVYNNVEEGWQSTNQFGFQHQFVIAPNPSTATLTSPVSDYTFTNPGTGGTGELKASSSATSSFSSTSTSALLTASGFASSEIITQDTTSSYWSSASGGVDLYLDLSTQAVVTFSLDSFNPIGNTGCQFGANNIYAADFLTAGNHSVSKTVAAGSYTLFMFFFTQIPVATSPVDSYGYAGGNYSISVQAVPEPSSMAIFGIGALGLLRLRRKKG
jgi:hypothetical protein